MWISISQNRILQCERNIISVHSSELKTQCLFGDRRYEASPSKVPLNLRTTLFLQQDKWIVFANFFALSEWLVVKQTRLLTILSSNSKVFDVKKKNENLNVMSFRITELQIIIAFITTHHYYAQKFLQAQGETFQNVNKQIIFIRLKVLGCPSYTYLVTKCIFLVLTYYFYHRYYGMWLEPCVSIILGYEFIQAWNLVNYMIYCILVILVKCDHISKQCLRD